jgi:hypothetical protein
MNRFSLSTVSATDLPLYLVMTEDCALSNIRIPSFARDFVRTKEPDCQIRVPGGRGIAYLPWRQISGYKRRLLEETEFLPTALGVQVTTCGLSLMCRWWAPSGQTC